MSLSILSLRDVFPEKFLGLNSITNDAIAAMLQINDTYNTGNYIISDADSLVAALRDDYEKNGDNYRIFQRTTDSSGNSYWTEVTNPDQLLATSVDLYFLKSGILKSDTNPGGKELNEISEENFVQIYSVNKLNQEKLIDTSCYADTAQRLAAVLYSLCAYNKKIMELQIGDIEAVNNEQIEVNRITTLLTTIQNNLTTLDQTISDDTATEHFTATVMPDILAFFVQRGLIDTSTSVGDLTADVVDKLKKILIGDVDATSDLSQFNSVECFKCWTEFLSVVRHAGPGADTNQENNVLNNSTENIKQNLSGKYSWIDVTAESDVEFDPYASFYWRKASEITNNPKNAMTGIGDHWVFDPRLRDINGNLLNTDGEIIEDGQSADSYAYFSGFAPTELNNLYPEDSYRVYNPDGSQDDSASNMGVGDGDGDGDVDTAQYVQYDVRFYGTNAPSSREDFIDNVAASLSRTFANDIHFIPTDWTSTSDGIITFTDDFWNYIDRNNDNEIGLYWGVTAGSTEEPGSEISGSEWGPAGGSNTYYNDIEYTSFVIEDPNSRTVGPDFGKMGITEHCRNGDDNPGSSQDDFWGVVIPFCQNDDPYTVEAGGLAYILTGPVYEGARSSDDKIVELNADQFALWSDTIRIYLDQVTNDNSLRSSEMQMSLQFSQQDLNTATSLMRSVYKLQTETTTNIR